MSNVFFTGWELWEEMTFVLAMAIVIVFCLGLFKLWWVTRRMRKQEILDEEKKARLTEMRKTGLSPKKSPKKRGDIPFGVRALQSGVEVDGIWVSRPNTPSRSSSKSKLTSASTTILEINEDGKTSVKVVPAEPRPLSAPHIRPHPFRTTSNLSMREGRSGHETPESQSSRNIPLPQISENSALASQQRRMGRLNEEALRRLEGQHVARAPQLTTYIPRSPLMSPNPSMSRNYYRPSQRSSASSESISSGGSSRNPSTSSSQRSYHARPGADGRSGYNQPIETRQASPVRFSTATSSSYLTGSSSDSHSPLISPQPISAPLPTFGPGDTFANRATRRVNAGFEVLPAGTFGNPHDLGSSMSGNNSRDEEDENSRNKLRKKNGTSFTYGP